MRRRSRLLGCSVETEKEHFNGELGMRTIFTLTGIEIETLQDGGFHLPQQRCVDQLELMSLSQRAVLEQTRTS